MALYMTVVSFGAMTDYWANFGFVAHVLSMDQLPRAAAFQWRAIASSWAHHSIFILIIATETISALLTLAGGAAMMVQVKTSAHAFHHAKWLAIAGLAIGFVLFEGGFVTIGGELFVMLQSKAWNGVDGASRVALTLLGVLIFISYKDDELG
jgi:predicted small integral membrane protein